MRLPKFCYTKLFWTIVSSSFAFTFFIYGVLAADISEVKADNNRQNDNIDESLKENQKMLLEIKEDLGYIKAKVEKKP